MSGKLRTYNGADALDPDSDEPCPCGGKHYIVTTRHDDNMMAVERCDLCWANEETPEDFSDEDAAKLAQADGIACRSEYPCYLDDQSIDARYEHGARPLPRVRAREADGHVIVSGSSAKDIIDAFRSKAS